MLLSLSKPGSWHIYQTKFSQSEMFSTKMTPLFAFTMHTIIHVSKKM